jgi:hypothetical protein
MAIAYFKHTAVGKTTQAEPYTAAAHGRYIMRKSAAMRIFSERMPRQYHAVQRFLNEREDSIRKNGRVCDKFIIAIPREFTPDQAEAVLRRWANRISQQRTPWLMAFHWDDHNPHAHCIFIDADTETGKRVFATSDKNATERLKVTWEATVNEQFAELGIETRIEFGAEQQMEADNDNAVSESSPPPPEVLEEPPTLEELDNDLGRVDYEEELAEALQEEELAEPVLEIEGATLADNARLGASACFELRRIRTLQAEIAGVRGQYEQASTMLTRAEQAAVSARHRAQSLLTASQAARETFMQEHRGLFGKKGFKVKAFGLEYVSPARKAADAAEAQYQWAKVEAEQAELARQHAEETQTYAQTVYQHARETMEAVQGNDAELQEAAEVMENTINAYSGELSRETILAMGEDGTLAQEQVNVLLEELGYDKGGIEQEY